MEIAVRGPEEPFCTTGHYPVLAGYHASGRETYLAVVRISKDEVCYTLVSDGARSVEYWSEARPSTQIAAGHTEVTSDFSVLVLRNDPLDGSPPYPEIPTDAVYQTGPVYWLCDDVEGEFSNNGTISETILTFIMQTFAIAKSLPPEVVGSRQEQDLREHHDAVHRQHYGNDVFSCSIPQPDSTAQLQQSRLPPEIATKGDDTSLDRAHPDIPADTVPRLEESSLAETNAAGTGDPQGVIQYGGKHTYAESELLNGGVLRYRTRSDLVTDLHQASNAREHIVHLLRPEWPVREKLLLFGSFCLGFVSCAILFRYCL